MKPTEQQAEIHDVAATLKPGDALKVIAMAGAGKTTTLKGCAEVRNERGTYLAFNKSIADEAARKLATTRCTASTMHSIAFQAMKSRMGGGSPSRVNSQSLTKSGVMNRHAIPRIRGWGDFRVASAICRTMSAFANSDDTEFSVDHARTAIMDAVGDPDFMMEGEKKNAAMQALETLSDSVAQVAKTYWTYCMDRGDYSHDMYLKMLDLDDGIRTDAFRGRKYLMVDEAQDINPVQRSIVVKTGLPLIAVGDPYQQIYSWRGAENALEKLPGRELYLTQSFRFGENIAAIARDVLALRPDGGPKHRLEGVGTGDVSRHKGARAAIICRTNIGMLDEALNALDKNFTVHVDKMDELISDVRSAKALHEGRMGAVTSTDIKQFDSWAQLEQTAEEGDASLNKIVKLVTQNRTGAVEALNAKHTEEASKAQVMICTGHRSKGLEFPGVRIGADWNDVSRLGTRIQRAKEKSQKHVTQAVEELNLVYVACTRSMRGIANHERVVYPKVDPVIEAAKRVQDGDRERDSQPA